MAAYVLYPERDRKIKKDRFGDTERGERKTEKDRDAEEQRHRERQRNRESQTDKQ